LIERRKFLSLFLLFLLSTSLLFFSARTDRACAHTDIIVSLEPFGITASPPSNEVTQGEAVSFTVNVSLVSAPTAPASVTLSLSGLPAGVSYTFTPSSGVPTFNSTLHITTSAETPTGTYVLNITAASGGVTRSTTVQLVIKEKPAGGLPILFIGVVVAVVIVVGVWTIISACWKKEKVYYPPEPPPKE